MNLLMQAEIFSITGLGKLRVTYNWLYSALNCDPNDNSSFIWNIYQTANNTIAMSPQLGYAGKTLYASVRDDWDYYVQVQAPHSADWITAAQRDEFIGLQMLDLGLVKLSGFNNELIGLLDQPDSGNIRTNGRNTGSHSGYRVRSIYGGSSKQTLWFLKITGGNTGAIGAASTGTAVLGTIGAGVFNNIKMNTGSLTSSLRVVLQQQGVTLTPQELANLAHQIGI